MLLIFIIIGAEAVERAGIIARQADVVAGLTLEVLKGTSRAFDSGNVFLLVKYNSYEYKATILIQMG